MYIASLSTNLAQDRLADQVGAKVLSMALKTVESSGESLSTILRATETVSDSATGSRLDTLV
ncbi:MAG: YjfB family protein [Spirochaetaceae bacterium]|nr:YjfB family protein [Spirochaetaceae bacterium]